MSTQFSVATRMYCQYPEEKEKTRQGEKGTQP